MKGKLSMNEKGCRRSALSAAVVSALAVGSSLLPISHAIAKPSSAHAIIGTGADAIIGTGADAIIGTGADAIIGTGLQKAKKPNAIIGTGADAIIGTGADAIIGTGADAIIGTGLQKGSSAAPLMKGPIDRVDVTKGTISLLGREFKIPSTSQLADSVQEAITSGRAVDMAVFGKIDGNGNVISAAMKIVDAQYIPGVTQVVLSGKIATLDASTARAIVQGITVDFTNLLASGNIDLKRGDIVTFTGTLPQKGQQLIATGLIKRGN